jgi:hypothetical protein
MTDDFLLIENVNVVSAHIMRQNDVRSSHSRRERTDVICQRAILFHTFSRLFRARQQLQVVAEQTSHRQYVFFSFFYDDQFLHQILDDHRAKQSFFNHIVDLDHHCFLFSDLKENFL